MKKLLLVIALMISIWGLNAQNANDSTKIAAPGNLVAETTGIYTIKLTWDAVENADSYSVYLDTVLFMEGIYDTTYYANYLDPGREYCFSVTAVDTSGVESEKSGEACAETMDDSCDVPTGLKVKVEIDVPDYGKKYKVTFSWDAVEGAELYKVYAQTQYYDEPQWIGDVNINEYVTGSDAPGGFSLYVRTVCDSKYGIGSELSEGIDAVFNDEGIVADEIESPENLTVTVKSETVIELKWDAVEDAKSYFVYRDSEEIANIIGTTYTDENLKADTEYCYVVTAMGVDEESDASDEVCATTSGEGIEELVSSFVIYPNPVETELFLATEYEVESIGVYDIYGRQTSVLQSTEFVNSVNVANLEAGVYFVKIVTSEGEIVKRFVKK